MANKIQSEFSTDILKVNIGIGDRERKLLVKNLSKVLADSYILCLKTQNFHWNVTGKLFRSLHEILAEQYLELQQGINEIALRIRCLGEFAPGQFSAFGRYTSLKEEQGVPEAEEMILHLIWDNETVIFTAREMSSLCNECEDDVTAELMMRRIKVHETNAWQLRSLIPQSSPH